MTRYRSLDGLRGLAALVVVVHHCLLTSRVLAGTYRGASTSGWGFDGLLSRTPLHLLWDGTGVVLVFFVLSGLVLTLGFTPSTGQRWASYYVKRLPRLYLPVLASLVFAIAVASVVPRLATSSQSWWVNAHAAPAALNATLSAAAKDATLIWPPSLLNSPLWSLQWEVAFSLLLPVYVVIAVHWRRLWWVKVCGALVLVGVGSKTGHASLLYLPVFALGAVLAVERDRLASTATGLGRRTWWAIGSVAVLLLTLGWMVGPLPEWVTRPLRSAGAALIVTVFLYCRGVGRFAGGRSVQWLGRISFSLYLVHEPIVVGVDRLLPGDPGAHAWAVLLTALPASLLVAAAFHRLVEVPSLRVARWMGRMEARPSQFWVAAAPEGLLDQGAVDQLTQLRPERMRARGQ